MLKSENAAAAVEFALILPVLAMVLLAIFQLGIAFNGYVAITHAAREGVRQASVGHYSEAAVRADAYPVNPSSISLTYPQGQKQGLPVQVTVRYNLFISIPFFGKQTIPLTSRAQMRSEV